MQRYVLNQYLNRTSFMAALRKVGDLVHLKQLPAKTGIGIFGGTLLLGTGVVFAAAQSSPHHATIPVLVHTPTSTKAEEPFAINSQAQTSDSTNEPQASESSSSTHQQSNSFTSNTEVTVNGQNIPLPSNGSIHKTIISNDGTTTVDVTSQTSSQNGTSSYTNVQTNSFTSGTTNSFSNQTRFNN